MNNTYSMNTLERDGKTWRVIETYRMRRTSPEGFEETTYYHVVKEVPTDEPNNPSTT